MGLLAAAEEVTPDEPVQLRITWGDGEPTQWFGRIAIAGGSLDDLNLLGSNTDNAGSIWLQDAEVRVASMSARARDAIKITAHGNKDSKLLIELSASAGAEPIRAEVPLADVLRTAYQLKLDDRGNALQVEIADGNPLRITFEREPQIFSPGEHLSFELQPTLAGLAPGTTLDLQTTLSATGGKAPLWSDQQRLAVPVDGALSVRLNIPMPRTDGVYTVRISATRPPGFRERFFAGNAVPLAERSFQVVVLSTNGQASNEPSEWVTVLEIDPTNPRWADRLPNWTQLRRIPGLNRGPLGSIRAGAINLPFGRFVELPSTAAASEPHWQAYSLPLETVGVPHQLEIEYPSSEEQHFGISIVEPNSFGVVEGIGRDTGVYVEGLGRSESKQPEIHRVVFWPRTQAPLLLVTNRHPTASAHFGRIRVRKRTTNRLAAADARNTLGDRLVAAYIGRPLLAQTFGVGRPPSAHDTATLDNTSEHDWQTHYDSATRLADYLPYAGYNSAVINVLGDGRSLSTDRAAIDSLELLLRVFDRDQLALLPVVQFSAPIAELEAVRRGSDPQTSGLEWVGPDGRTWLEVHGSGDGLAPYYNLLDPRVQQSMTRVVRELIDRYGNHAALAGVAVQLSSDGYAQLPPLEWGMDDVTVARFERDTGVNIDATGASRFAARHTQLTGPLAGAWRSWRTQRVTEFYGKLATLVRTGNERRRLLVTTEESLDHPQLAARVRPNILAGNRVHGTLLDLGIDQGQLQKMPGIALCATTYQGPTVPLRARAVDLEINDAFNAPPRQTEMSDRAAAMIYHRPNRLRLSSLSAKWPFELATEATLVSQPLAHGAMVREPYATAIASSDCSIIVDGGQLLPLGQEDLLRRARLLLQRLPSAAQLSQFNRQPVLVRTYSEASCTTVLVVNTCPWRTNGQVQLDVPQAAALEPLVSGEEAGSSTAVTSKQLAPGRQPWSFSLEPYELQAVRIAAASVQVADVQAQVSPAAKTELAAQISDLNNRDTAPRIYPSLANPSFEPIGAGTVPGWQLAENAGAATAELDATMPHDGKTCLYLRGPGPKVVIESNRFATPATGQLAMTVFVRGQNLAPQSELRMVIEADQAGYGRRSVVVGGVLPDAYPLDDQWRCYPILVNDLPFTPQGQAQIKFELTGAGEVWMDEVKVYDLLFPLTFYKYRQTESLQIVKEIQAAQSAFNEEQITDCVRSLEGYWPRFLASYTPLANAPVANQPLAKPAETSTAPPDPPKQPAPSFGERFRWLPKFR